MSQRSSTQPFCKLLLRIPSTVLVGGMAVAQTSLGGGRPTAVPEIDGSLAAKGLFVLLAGLLILTARRRTRSA